MDGMPINQALQYLRRIAEDQRALAHVQEILETAAGLEGTVAALGKRHRELDAAIADGDARLAALAEAARKAESDHAAALESFAAERIRVAAETKQAKRIATEEQEAALSALDAELAAARHAHASALADLEAERKDADAKTETARAALERIRRDLGP